MSNIGLSIIVTAHSEGILLHRTLRSAIGAAAVLTKERISWELLIHVDKGSKETLDYIEANKSFLAPFTICYNSFGDLAESRNFMVKKATGKTIAFLDADDLISEDWFASGMAYLHKLDRPAVLHTEWLVNFGEQNLVWRKFDSRTKEEDALIMVWANRWDSAVIAPREIFEQYPYANNTAGYGSEDWHFGSQTLAAGILHFVVPRTVIFARRKDVSEMSIQKTDFRTVHYTDLLDIEFVKNIDLDKTLSGRANSVNNPTTNSAARKMKTLAFRALRKGYRIAARQPVANRLLSGIGLHVLNNRRHSAAVRFPGWLTSEWRAMHSIDKQVFPDRQLLSEIPIYISEMYELGIAYQKLAQFVSKSSDYIIIVPHLVAGGADLVVLNYVRVIQKIHPDWHILVIATDNTPSPWVERLPSEVDYMPLGETLAASGIWEDLHLQLFARLIVQLKCKKLHIIQSRLGFNFAMKYKSLLTANRYTVYACAFCEDIDEEGRFIGHIHSGLPGAYPILKNIFTDNQAVVNQLVHEYGYAQDKFIVHYQPAELTAIQKPKQKISKPYRILWASRVSTQKRPDILKQIAQKLDPDTYTIDAYGSLHNGYTAEYFANIPALKYKGTFNGLGSIDLKSYDMFLYTSANDGVPNILLGIAAAGLPIVASSAGGVGEFIQQNKTGFLIDRLEDIDAYVAAINKLRSDQSLAKTLATNAQKLLQTRHSESAFVEEIRKLDI